MTEIKKMTHYNILFDFYKNLLTEKQIEYFIMYFEKDYSLKEIADYYNVTRNAVHSALTTTIAKLDDFEEKLKLYFKSEQRKKYYEKHLKTKDDKWLKLLMEVDDDYGF